MAYYFYDLLFEPEGPWSFLRLLSYISFRSIFAFITAFGMSLFFGRRLIRWFAQSGIQETARQDTDLLDESKRGTPTMGGILILVSVLIPTLLWCNLQNSFVWILLLTLMWFSGIGGLDDFLKLRGGHSELGLSRAWKLALQTGFGLFLAWCTQSSWLDLYPAGMAADLNVPFNKAPLISNPWVYVPFVTFVTVAISNAVNFADGLDGLAIVPASVTTAVYAVFAYILGNVNYATYLLYAPIPGTGEITIFCAAVIGAGMGFLWYNTYPAQIFMGDVGSLALGGMLATLAVLLKQEVLFLIAGGIFLVEALSVVIQDRIGIARLGRRLLFRAPLHHTFQHRGIAEPTVVVRFWIVSILLALLSIASLKIR